MMTWHDMMRCHGIVQIHDMMACHDRVPFHDMMTCHDITQFHDMMTWHAMMRWHQKAAQKGHNKRGGSRWSCARICVCGPNTENTHIPEELAAFRGPFLSQKNAHIQKKMGQITMENDKQYC